MLVEVKLEELNKDIKKSSKRIYNKGNSKKVDEDMLSVKYGKTKSLKGDSKKIFKKVGDGSRIVLFEKTPYPEKPSDVVCPHFVEFKWANGCPFNCSWCYLQGTFRFLDRGKKPHIKDMKKTERHLDTFLQEVSSKSYVLNTGELSDSLIGENRDTPFSKWVINKFENENPYDHKVLFLTKSNNIENLLKIKNHEHSIMSFSLNAFKVSERWEKAPYPKDRIEAARKLFENDYETRIRIDPMVPVNNWQEKYKNLVDTIFESLTPERITMGSLRGLSTTIRMANDTSWVKYLDDSSNWGKKVSFGKRLSMYSMIKNYLEKEYDYTDIAFCKESREIWEDLNMDWREIKCNCVF